LLSIACRKVSVIHTFEYMLFIILRNWMIYEVILIGKYDANHACRYAIGDLGTKGSRRVTPDSLGFLFNDRHAHRNQLCNPKIFN